MSLVHSLKKYMRFTAALAGIALLAISTAWADYYGSMGLPPSTIHLTCKDVDDDIFVVGTCDTYSYGTPLHLLEDCEITAVAQTKRRQWEWEGPLIVTHRVPADFVSAQTFSLDSEDPGDGTALVSHFVVHIAARPNGSFTATMDHLTLRCAD